MNRVTINDIENFEIKEMLEDILINIAWANCNFICEECLNTVNKLLNIYYLFTDTDEEAEEFKKEINEIIYGEN